jgi:hypothetical protein
MVSFTPRPLYLQAKNPWYPLDRRLGGPQCRSGQGGEEKNSQPLPGLEPSIQPVAQRYTAELTRLLLYSNNSQIFLHHVSVILLESQHTPISLLYSEETFRYSQPFEDSPWGPLSFLPSAYRGTFPGDKTAGREADHSLPSCAEVKIAWSYTCTPQYVLIPWWFVKLQVHGKFCLFTFYDHYYGDWQNVESGSKMTGENFQSGLSVMFIYY